MTTNATKASYTKLQDGSWGIRVPESLRATAGDVVTVTKASGETKTETVSRVLWTGQGISLCSIQQSAASAARASGSSRRSSGSRVGSCGCDCGSCYPRCQCESHCNCRGGNVYDC
jgi:hypothetical protein